MKLTALYYTLLNKAENATTNEELDQVMTELNPYKGLLSRLCVEIVTMTVEDRREAIA